MNSQATFKSPKPALVHIFSVFFYAMATFAPSALLGQDKFLYTKNTWQEQKERLCLKKLGIYSDFENVFFLKRAEKKPSTTETWAIFGEEGGTIYLQRDDSLVFQSGKMTFAQVELSISQIEGQPCQWVLSSRSDTLHLSLDTPSLSCRLYRTIKVASAPDAALPTREVELMQFLADSEGVKRIRILDKSPADQRWTAFRICACLLSVDAIGQLSK